MIVIDCSIIMAAILPDENNSLAIKIFRELAADAKEGVVPSLFYLEWSNVLLSGYRRKRITRKAWLDYLDVLTILPLKCDDYAVQKSGIKKVADFAERFDLTIYDATYLELASRKNIPLATLDRKLQAAALNMEVAYS